MTDAEPTTHFRVLPDGRIEDLHSIRGTSVRIVSGPHRGLTGRVDSATFERHSRQPGYHVQLSNQKWGTVGWDEVEEMGQPRPANRVGLPTPGPYLAPIWPLTTRGMTGQHKD